MIVASVKSVPTYDHNSIRQNGFGNGGCRSNTDAWNHGFLGFFRHKAGIQFDIVWVIVQVAKLLGNLGVRVDALESVVGLQAKEFGEFIQRCQTPFSDMVYAQDIDRMKCFRHVVCAEGACRVSACDAFGSIITFTSAIFDTVREYLDQVIIGILALGISLKSSERALLGILVQCLVPLCKSSQ